MKKIIGLIALASLMFACGSGKQKQKNTETLKKVVTVSILPERTFVEKIAGDDFKVNLLIPSGASPAAYTLLPSQLKDIANSYIWFRVGYIGFELSWKDKIEQANKNMKVVDLSEGLDLIRHESENKVDRVHAGGEDPHIWLSPALVKKMAKKIADELTLLNPDHGSDYKLNYLKFVKEIDQLNIKIKNALKDYQGREIIVFHPSLSYYARDFGLVQYSLESGGKEPTPHHLAEVVDLAKKKNIKVIYIQSEFDRDNARVFADEIGGKIIEVWPLNPAWEDNLMEMTNTFIDNF
ncbi:MAG TPA: zinc ABC transporter substrate-binding protein [Draconibacterium sp.]|nr:zinc ABC transporter substrate-binding protein [Draconibacterium sp.]